MERVRIAARGRSGIATTFRVHGLVDAVFILRDRRIPLMVLAWVWCAVRLRPLPGDRPGHPAVHRLTSRITMDFDVGVFEISAVESSGTNAFASGK